MDPFPAFEERLTTDQRRVFRSLDSLQKIQAFLDETPYSTDHGNRSPLSVLRDGVAHCLDGALFGAAAIRRLGYPPVVIDLLPEPGRDDDHVLVLFQRNGCYGALAKSNYPGLRYREPIFRTLRELTLSYFEWFFNTERQKTLRGYTATLNLAKYDPLNWLWEDSAADEIERSFARLRRYSLVSEDQKDHLLAVDPLLYKAGTVGVNLEGVFQLGDH
jgi:hypothetical protein